MKGTICIAGTGRSGTTFLMRLFTLMGLHTSYTKADILGNKVDIDRYCNSGLERYNYVKPPLVFKDPNFIQNPKKYISWYAVKTLIIPIRDYHQSALSRSKYLNSHGGFIWGATNIDEQVEIYYKYIAETIRVAANAKINLVILDFDSMVSDPKYLFQKLSFLFKERYNNKKFFWWTSHKNIEYDFFLDKYNLATELSKQ
jgi:hypothetical protein